MSIKNHIAVIAAKVGDASAAERRNDIVRVKTELARARDLATELLTKLDANS